MGNYEVLIKARQDYALNGISDLTDQDYDRLLKEYLGSEECTELQRIVLSGNAEDDLSRSFMPTEVGMSTNFSIRSVDTWDALDTWQLSHPPNSRYKVSIKIDGVRGNIKYKASSNDPHLYLLQPIRSRGNKGNDIQYHDNTQHYLPKQIRLGQAIGEFDVTAEYFVFEKDMEELGFLKQQNYASPLNAAVSCARTGIPYERESLLHVCAHRLFLKGVDTRSKEVAFLNQANIPVVPNRFCLAAKLKDTIIELRLVARNNGYPTDGIVIELNEGNDVLQSKNGKTAYDDMIALKLKEWVQSEYDAIVEDIKFEMVGAESNAILIVEPVKTREGKTVTRVNAFNPSNILNKIRIGDKIQFEVKSNNYINFVRKVED